MSKQKKIIIAIVIIAILIAIYFWWKKKNEAEGPAPEVSPGGAILASPFPLHEGSSGKEVKQYQTWLYKQHGGDINKLLGPKGIDGVFGTWTRAASEKVTKSDTVTESFFKEKGIDKIIVQ